jgi:heme-degrading monooxygenase HmoA
VIKRLIALGPPTAKVRDSRNAARLEHIPAARVRVGQPTEEVTMHDRTTIVDGDPGRIDDVLRQIESEVLPVLKEQDGFKGFTVHVNRSSGKVVGTSYWESQDSMQASEEAVRGPREEAAQRGGASSPTVEHFEVAIDTMA